MLTSIDSLQSSASGRRHASLARSRKAASAASRPAVAAFAAALSGGSYGVFAGTGAENLGKFQRQYAAVKDVTWTAIRPAALKIAELPLRAGFKTVGGEASKPPKPGKPNLNSSSDDDKEGNESQGGNFPSRKPPRKSLGIFTKATDAHPWETPTYIRSEISSWQKSHGESNVDAIDTHPLLESIEDPNPLLTRWGLLFCTGVSLLATGRGLWWIEEGGTGQDGSEQPFTIWYIPCSWAKPLHLEGKPFAAWKITPPGTNESDGWIVSGDDMLHFFYPDPGNPTKPWSTIQAISRPINTDDQIQTAQFSALVNAVKPGMVIKAGRLPDPRTGSTSTGPRPILQPEQRSQLISAIKLAYGGATKSDEPIIVDGLIEDVVPYTRGPAEMDYRDSMAATADRIRQGIGTNKFVAGDVEGSNRASSYVATQNFYDVVVNPMATLMSQTITNFFRRRENRENREQGQGGNGNGSRAGKFGLAGKATSAAGRKLLIWLEHAVAFDQDLKDRRVTMLSKTPELFTKDELRHWAMTGEADFPPLGEEGGGNEPAVKTPPKPPAPSPPVAAGAKENGDASGGSENPSSRKPAKSGKKPADKKPAKDSQ